MIAFVCTDKSTHRRVVLGNGSAVTGNVMGRDMYPRNAPDRSPRTADGEWRGWARPGENGKRTSHGKAVLSPYVKHHFIPDGQFNITRPPTVEFLCPKCGRNPLIGGDKMDAAIARLRDAGIAEVDISRLPF